MEPKRNFKRDKRSGVSFGQSCAKILVTGNFLVFKRLVMILLKGKYNECFQKKKTKINTFFFNFAFDYTANSFFT